MKLKIFSKKHFPTNLLVVHCHYFQVFLARNLIFNNKKKKRVETRVDHFSTLLFENVATLMLSIQII